MKTCTDSGCSSKALRNSPMCMEHVKSGSSYTLRPYQENMLLKMASMRAMLDGIDARRVEEANRDRAKVWEKVDMRGITIHQSAVPWDSYSSRGWFGMNVPYQTPGKRVAPDSWTDIKRMWK